MLGPGQLRNWLLQAWLSPSVSFIFFAGNCSGTQAYANQHKPIQGGSFCAYTLNCSRETEGEGFYSVWGRSQLAFTLSQSPHTHSHPSAIRFKQSTWPQLLLVAIHKKLQILRHKTEINWVSEDRYFIKSLNQPTTLSLGLPVMWASKFPYWLSKFKSGFLILMVESILSYKLSNGILYKWKKSVWYSCQHHTYIQSHIIKLKFNRRLTLFKKKSAI